MKRVKKMIVAGVQTDNCRNCVIEDKREREEQSSHLNKERETNDRRAEER